MYRFFLFCAAVWLCISSACALDTDEMLRQAGAPALYQALPPEAEAALQELQLDASPESLADTVTQLFRNLDTRRFFSGAVRGVVKMMVVCVIVGALSGLQSAAGGTGLPVITMAGALGLTGILLSDLHSLLSLCVQTIEQISVFSTTLLPVMAGALTVAGAPAAATVTQGATMFAMELLIRFITGLLVPAVYAYVALLTVNAALGNDILHGTASFVRWLTTGSLKLILTVFIAYLSISGAVGGSVDAVTLKTAKFAVSGSVPVVGGIISDATESMLAGMAAVKNTIGILGMCGVAAICLAPFLQVGVNYLLFKAGAAILSPVCSGSLGKLMNGLSDSFGLMLGMLGTCSAILFFELVFSITMVKPT